MSAASASVFDETPPDSPLAAKTEALGALAERLLRSELPGNKIVPTASATPDEEQTMREHHQEFFYRPLGRTLRRWFPANQLQLMTRFMLLILLAYLLFS
ncbi:MAG: hypothetical protein RL120_10785 [Gammaproteobacteria bacterium]